MTSTFDPSLGGSNPKPRFKQQFSRHYSSIGFQLQLLWLPSLERDLEGVRRDVSGVSPYPPGLPEAPAATLRFISRCKITSVRRNNAAMVFEYESEVRMRGGPGRRSGRREPIAIGLRKLTQDKKGLFTPDRQGQGGRQPSCHRLAERSAHCFHHRSLIKLTIQYANSGTIH